jgi:thioredoxin-like negative regulator of GroEL
MANRFNVYVPVANDPVKEAAALHVKELAEKDFDAESAAALPMVLDFYSAGSAPCEALAPRLAAVAEKYAGKARFFKVLVEGNAALAAKLGITASPTLVFLQGGVEKGARLTGAEIKRTELKARVDAMLGIVAPVVPVAPVAQAG